jgi:hypothetical protein
VDGASVSAVFEPPAGGDLQALFVCGHGAGGHMADKAMLAVTAALRGCGLGVVRFNFVYRELQRKRPDPMPQLQACVAAVAQQARALLQPKVLILGGRSMGGRAASMLVAGGFACDGLLLLAYPLHPAGELTRLRDAHLPDIAVPVLCFNGTRDALCDPALMQRTVEPLSDRWTMHWLQGADHAFHVLKSSGRTDAEVLSEVGSATRGWLGSLVGVAH